MREVHVRLVKAQVSKFKSVTDTTQFTVDEKVTALVGKNESGKTAVLQALYRLNPLASGHPVGFEDLRDYPRRYRSRDRKTISTTAPVELTFELEDADRASVEGTFGPGAMSGSFTLSCRYGETSLYWQDDIDDLRVLRHLVASSGLDPDRYMQGDVETTIAGLAADTQAPAATTLATDLSTRNLANEVRQHLYRHLPRFQYFDEYNILPGSVSVHRLQTVAENDLSAGERTALSLLRLAGVESAEFSEAEYEPRKAALEAAANQLTDELFDYWTQNTDLSVELDIEFRPTPGSPVPEPWLQIRVRNQRHRVTLNMAERSKGFIWFFSFLAAFSEYADEDRRVVLLDEPGTSLHARAQSDLLRFIDERIAPHHQVIYTTHSLFMIEPTRLARCRTVEDLDTVGTSISEDIWAARPDTVFPLLGALGVDMTQTLIIGADQLVVEGPADVVYLTVMSDLVRQAGGTPLDPRWTLTPVGGLDKIPTFIALLGGSDLNVTVLMDVAAGGNQKVTGMVQRGLLDARRLVPLTEITETAEADLEDLFDPAWYLDLLRASGVAQIPLSASTGGRIVKQAEAALGAKFDHYQPANYLMRSPGALLTRIDDATMKRFERLFGRLNALLD